jgi:apolipoprotein N-acyltransferase
MTTEVEPAPPATDPKLPLNRIVAFAGPYIALASGAIVDWLFVHLHFLANWHTNQSSITTWLTQALVFGLTSLLVWLGQQSWLKGWIEWESKAGRAILEGIKDTPVPAPPPPAPVQTQKPLVPPK